MNHTHISKMSSPHRQALSCRFIVQNGHLFVNCLHTGRLAIVCLIVSSHMKVALFFLLSLLVLSLWIPKKPHWTMWNKPLPYAHCACMHNLVVQFEKPFENIIISYSRSNFVCSCTNNALLCFLTNFHELVECHIGRRKKMSKSNMEWLVAIWSSSPNKTSAWRKLTKKHALTISCKDRAGIRYVRQYSSKSPKMKAEGL